MNGWLAASLVFYALVTFVSVMVTSQYDKWITRAHESTEEPVEAARRVIPTSFLVAIGVGGVELMRAIRIVPLAAVVSMRLGYPVWLGAAIVGGGLLIDALIAYLAAGFSMIRGDLLRDARAWLETDAIHNRQLRRLMKMVRAVLTAFNELVAIGEANE